MKRVSDGMSPVEEQVEHGGGPAPPGLAGASAWHSLTVEAALQALETDAAQGLSEAVAAERLERWGPNEIQGAERVSPWRMLLEQFKNVLILILLFAAGLSAVLGHGLEAVAIAVIVLFAVFLGFVQEYRAERAIEALQEMAAPTAAVIRERAEQTLPARSLVPGDIILLRAGNRVPADARLIESINLQAEEAALTGESVPVEKHTAALDHPDLPPGDRRNMVLAGTAVTYGRGRAVVAATGMNTEFGKIARLLQTVEEGKTPLQQNLDRVGAALARAALVVVLIVVGIGLLRGQPLLEMFIFGIALAVAVVPEALPAVVTISLAIGVQRMVRRNALIRRLPAVETLGSTSIICSDKTGTLTKDEMTVRKVYVHDQIIEVSGAGYQPYGEFLSQGKEIQPPAQLKTLLRAAVLSSDAVLVGPEGGNGGRRHSAEAAETGWAIKGDPTEGAMIVAAAKAGLAKPALEAEYPRIGEIPFTSESKRMTTVHRSPQGNIAYAKGAPEAILPSCTRILTAGGEQALDEAGRQQILAVAQQMAGEALRVLGVACKPGAALENAEREMTFVGLVGMIDPPRPEAREAIQTCESAGIKPIMITGDHPVTARAIAEELGILKTGQTVTGVELEALTEEAFRDNVENIEVYARVSPAHKLKVVTALQDRGHVVAMTGDGVNDAPALKKADIGVAMGITGTDVTKEAAAMTLTDDNFASIVAAVEEGRAVFENIKKYLMFLLSSNIGEILLMTAASILGLPLPLTAVQILYVNLATDGLPALALAVDPHDFDLMRRRPRNPRTGIFTRPVITLMVAGGVWSAIVNLTVFAWALGSGRSLLESMTMTFTSLVLIQFFKAYNFRSDRYTVLRRPFANKWLNLAVFWELVLLVVILYVPFLQEPFTTYPLTAVDWLVIGLASITISPVLELVKWMIRRKEPQATT